MSFRESSNRVLLEQVSDWGKTMNRTWSKAQRHQTEGRQSRARAGVWEVNRGLG